MYDPDQLKPHFRAINTDGKRRGFRLERVFWTALEDLTGADGVSVSDYVARLHDGKTGDSGLSSLLRASIMRRLLLQYEGLRARIGRFNSRTIIAACPVPAFIISVEKKILFQNSAFLMYLQTRFTGLDNVAALGQIKLTLEMPLADLIEQMKADSSRPKYTGFTIGYGERLLRGRLSLALAPDMDDPPAAIAFVSGPS
ncbi:ribbon-helix-helix domain-containing protein [Hoeflea ulvae]|uniref:Ribbon-helix-helix domain-containing protein n=1 Tax=Hoeflea ulvae TaxID=2983764 RepID=A0ABT3YCQ1_9HYPH|nr:ribbon-helix-helix domain-containing protein [Hoeflea ulvae]MCY0093654.1 ribbon-helix-helix domain-containing protein [Hoeflea ulvae]